MSLRAALALPYGKRPVVLAEITRGAVTWRYHMGRADVILDGETFAGSTIGFDGITYSAEVRKDDLTLTGFPLSDSQTQELMAGGAVATSLVLRRGFEGFADFAIFYRGQMTAVKPQGREVSLVFASWSVDAGRRGDGFVAQRQCPWRVYSPECGAVLADHDVAGTATAYAAGVVTCAAADAAADGTYVGGLVMFGGDARMVVKHVGAALTLSGSFPALAAEIADAGTAAVTLAPGCDHSATTCRDRFDNIVNHMGFPLMADNPFVRRVF